MNNIIEQYEQLANKASENLRITADNVSQIPLALEGINDQLRSLGLSASITRVAKTGIDENWGEGCRLFADLEIEQFNKKFKFPKSTKGSKDKSQKIEEKIRQSTEYVYSCSVNSYALKSERFNIRVWFKRAN